MNKILDYLCIAENNLSLMLDDEIMEADTGEDSTVAEGKENLIHLLDLRIDELQKFRKDVQEMSFTKFKQKYDG